MGIQGLLPICKPHMTRRNLSHYTGKVAAIDTFVWIHRGLIPSARDIAYKRFDVKNGKYIQYVFKYVDLLISHGIKPLLVFDGEDLPSKKLTEDERRQRRRTKMKEAIAMDQQNRQNDAFKLFQQTLDVTFEMVNALIAKARKRGVDYLVAPHEADIQIAYLVKNKFADVAITEDSDLIAMGCPLTIYKMKADRKEVEEACLETILSKSDLFKTAKQLRLAAVLQGCDYFPGGVPRAGLKTIGKWFKTSDKDQSATLESMFEEHPLLVKHKEEYIDECRRALRTFDHQVVFSPKTLRRQHCLPLTDDVTEEMQVHFGTLNKTRENHRSYNLHFTIGNVNYSNGQMTKTLFNLKKPPTILTRFSTFLPKDPQKSPEKGADKLVSPMRRQVESVSLKTQPVKKRTSAYFSKEPAQNPLQPSTKKQKVENKDNIPKSTSLKSSKILKSSPMKENLPKSSSLNSNARKKVGMHDLLADILGPKAGELTESEKSNGGEQFGTEQSSENEATEPADESYSNLAQLAENIETNQKQKEKPKDTTSYKQNSFFRKKVKQDRNSKDSVESDESADISLEEEVVVSSEYIDITDTVKRDYKSLSNKKKPNSNSNSSSHSEAAPAKKPKQPKPTKKSSTKKSSSISSNKSSFITQFFKPINKS